MSKIISLLKQKRRCRKEESDEIFDYIERD